MTPDYNLTDQFETFSRHDGHCGSSIAPSTRPPRTDGTKSVNLDAFQPSTIYTSAPGPNNEPVGCNDEHEGLNYQILLDRKEKAEYIPFDTDPSFQEGTL